MKNNNIICNYLNYLNYILQIIFVYIFAFLFNIPSYSFIVKYGNVSYYLGDMHSTKKCIENNRLNVKLIVNCTHDLENIKLNNETDKYAYYRIPISDIHIKKSTNYLINNIQNITENIRKILDLYKKQDKLEKSDLEQNEIAVLFHCRNGCQRSAICLAMYLSLQYNIDIDGIIDIIKKNRNMSFKPYLFKNCVKEYKKKKYVIK